jgi:hypothetical protein
MNGIGDQLTDFRNFFKKNLEEQKKILEAQKLWVLNEDRIITKLLGYESPEIIMIVRRVREMYDAIRHKQIRKEVLTEEEANFIEDGKIKEDIKNETKREYLVKKEVGTADYAIEEVAASLISLDLGSTKTKRKRDTTEVIEQLIRDEDGTTLREVDCPEIVMQNEEKEGSSKGREEIEVEKRKATMEKEVEENKINDINASIWAHKIEEREKKEGNRIQKVEGNAYLCTVWDLCRREEIWKIRNNLRFYGNITILETQYYDNKKAVCIKVENNKKERLHALKEKWAIHYTDGRILKITPGKFDRAVLTKRSRFGARVTNVPYRAEEGELLEQARRAKAKMVYIPKFNNSYRRSAFIYFDSEEELRDAQSKPIFYYNTRLYWCRDRIERKERIDGRERNDTRYYHYHNNEGNHRRWNRPRVETRRQVEFARRNSIEVQQEQSVNPHKGTKRSDNTNRTVDGEKRCKVDNENKEESRKNTVENNGFEPRQVESDENWSSLLNKVLERLENLEKSVGAKGPQRSQ